MAELRICAEPNCTTILSRFNDSDRCSAHPTALPFDDKRSYKKLSGMPPRSDQAAYMKAYRAVKRNYAERNRQLNNARSAAALRVASNHPKEFEEAYKQERQVRGIL